VGKRSRRRAKDAPAQPVTTSDYRDGEGNVLTLRDSLTEGTLQKLQNLDAKPAASAEDRWQRKVEFLFERLVDRWEIAGLPLESQKELIGRMRMASAEEKRFVQRTLADHMAEHYPDVTV
jgi:hypothetical protein